MQAVIIAAFPTQEPTQQSHDTKKAAKLPKAFSVQIIGPPVSGNLLDRFVKLRASKIEPMAVIIQAIIVVMGSDTKAIEVGDMKIPEPIVFPITIAIAAKQIFLLKKHP